MTARLLLTTVLFTAISAEPTLAAVLNRSKETICVIKEGDSHEVFPLPPDSAYFGRQDGFAFPHAPPQQRIFKTPGRWGLGCNAIIWERDDIEVECDFVLTPKAGWRDENWVKRRAPWRKLVECSARYPSRSQ